MVANIFFSVGIPQGYALLQPGITLEPVFQELYTQEFSLAGSAIYAKGKGFGVDDKMTLVRADTGVDICTKTEIKAYGRLKCEISSSQKFDSETKIQLKSIAKDTTFDCTHSDPTKCALNALTDTSQPKVITASIDSSTELTLVTENFMAAADFNCEVSFKGQLANKCDMTQLPQVKVTFDLGIPLFEASSALEVKLVGIF